MGMRRNQRDKHMCIQSHTLTCEKVFERFCKLIMGALAEKQCG